MIERFLTKELSIKRWRRFKKRKPAVISLVLFLIALFLTFSAEMIANSKPIILHYHGKTYFPVFKTYSAKEFGVTDRLVVNYKTLELNDGDWDLWPIVHWDPFESNKDVESYPSAPTLVNWFGTDDRGRDVFTRILYGFRYSISYAVSVWILSYFIGVIIGGSMGYFGGWLDFIGMRLVEIFSTIPYLFLLIILVSIFKPSLGLLIVITSLFGWIGISYYIRAEFLKNRKKEFVEAAKAIGVPSYKIIFKHILPNSLSPIVTFAPFFIAMQIMGLAGLDYLGFGLEVPTPSWGELLNQAQKWFTIAWWLAVFPSAAMFVTLTSLNLIGEGVRDAMDPNLT
jgi:microcin C transport system permease protein